MTIGRQPAMRIDLLLLVQLHHRLLLLHLVVAVALADRHHLRLHRLHLRHRGIGLVGEREEDDLDQHGDDQDGDAEISDLAVDPVEREEHRLGDEAEVAPVDQQLEAVELELGIVMVDDLDLLGPGEQPRIGRGGGAGRDGLRIEQVIGLELLDVVGKFEGKACAHLGRDIGEERGCPILVGEAEPRIHDIEVLRLLLLHLRVGLFLQALVAHNADQTLVHDVVAERRRYAVARDQRVGIERHRGGALVHHLILEGEEIFVVDRDGATELEPFAVVVDQRHRMFDRERARPFLPPQRIGGRRLGRGARRHHPAEFGIERMRAARRRQQHDRR